MLHLKMVLARTLAAVAIVVGSFPVVARAQAGEPTDAGVVEVAPAAVESPQADGDAGGSAAPLQPVAEAPDAGAAPPPAPAPAPAAEPQVAQRPPEPGFGTSLGVKDFEVRITAALRLAQSVGSPLVLDDLGTTTSLMPFETRLRLGPEVRWRGFSLVSDFDVATGALTGIPASSVVAARVPVPAFQAAQLRQLYGQYRWSTGALRLGQQVSHFGQGMLANGGAKDPEAGDFGLQHGGNFVLRALVAGRPLFGWGGAWRAVEPVFAFDLVVSDATAKLLEGDRALQGIVGLRFNVDEKRNLGALFIYRNQRRDGGAPGERATDAFVLDLFGTWTFLETPSSALTVGGELTAITGTTTQGRSDTAEVLDVRQLGAVAKVGFRTGRLGLLFDAGYASGDQNPYDAQLNSFRFDPNYKVGLVLFDQVLGYQTARSALRASDPLLVGVPPEGVDLLPSAGSISGAWFLFPRVKVDLTEWLNVYAGPLFAFSSARLTDPFNTRLNGGVPLNFLGGSPGGVLGTELDLGLTVRFSPAKYFTLAATLEGGVLLPGDAFRDAAGAVPGPTGLGRLRLTASL